MISIDKERSCMEQTYKKCVIINDKVAQVVLFDWALIQFAKTIGKKSKI